MSLNINRLKSAIEAVKYEHRITQGEIADKLGYKTPYLSDVINGRKPISEQLTSKFQEVFPELNTEWLLYGEGEMLKPDKRDGVITISTDQITEVVRGTPVYDLDATCGHMLRNFEDVEIIGYVDLPDISSDVHIITASGDSMEPEIFNNDRISVREILSWDIIYFGQIYLVLTSDYRMLKYIRKHPKNNDYIILRSANEKYDDVELPKAEIIKLFVVENIISIKNKM